MAWVSSELAASAAWAGSLVYAGALLAESYGPGPGTVGVVLGLGAAAYLPGNLLAKRWAPTVSRRLLVVLPVAAATVVAAFGAVRPGLVVSAALSAMGMAMLPPSLISLPFKLLLFVAVDGWYLLVSSLMRSFA